MLSLKSIYPPCSLSLDPSLKPQLLRSDMGHFHASQIWYWKNTSEQAGVPQRQQPASYSSHASTGWGVGGPHVLPRLPGHPFRTDPLGRFGRDLSLGGHRLSVWAAVPSGHITIAPFYM